MKDNILYRGFIAVFICFVADSTISFFLPSNYTKSSIVVIPYLGLMLFSMLVKDIQGPDRYFFAGVCGTYYSVVYSNSLAIYILIYCLIAFVRSYVIKLESFSMLEASLFCVSVICFGELIVYWLMWITSTTQYSLWQFSIMRLLPTLGVNFILSFFVYYIYSRIRIENR